MLGSIGYIVAKVVGVTLAVLGGAIFLFGLLAAFAGAGGYPVNAGLVIGSLLGGKLLFLVGYFLVPH